MSGEAESSWYLNGIVWIDPKAKAETSLPRCSYHDHRRRWIIVPSVASTSGSINAEAYPPHVMRAKHSTLPQVGAHSFGLAPGTFCGVESYKPVSSW